MKYKVTFEESGSGSYAAEDDWGYMGDLVREVVVESKTWAESFTKAANIWHYNNPNSGRLLNFNSIYINEKNK